MERDRVRKALFIGGPCDGKAMLVSGWVNSEIRLPVINNEHLSQMYEAEELELQYIKHQIARYMRYPLALPPFAGPPPETKCDIYIFRGIE